MDLLAWPPLRRMAQKQRHFSNGRAKRPATTPSSTAIVPRSTKTWIPFAATPISRPSAHPVRRTLIAVEVRDNYLRLWNRRRCRRYQCYRYRCTGRHMRPGGQGLGRYGAPVYVVSIDISALQRTRLQLLSRLGKCHLIERRHNYLWQCHRHGHRRPGIR
jgi:hypothetical protein